jgi:hypothetical protein
MRNSRIFLKRVAIALGALLLVSAVGLAQVTVSLPTATYSVGSTQAIPITVGDLTGQAAISFQTTVTYNKAIVKITGVTTTGTLSVALNAPVVNNDTAAGKITIVGAGTSAMAGSGTLIYLNATVVGKGSTALTFTSFQFNEGTPAVTLTNGSVTVPSLAVKISDVSTLSGTGGIFNIPITTEDITGQNVISYQFTATFDQTKFTIAGASVTGTMSSGMNAPVVNTTVAGRVTVVVAGTTALTGAGTLINLVATVVAAGASTANLTSFQFNEGTPAVAGLGGTITIGTNQKPTITKKMADTTIAENQALAFTYLATDPEAGALTFSATGLPTGATLSTAGALAWTPSYTQAGTYNFKVFVTDNASLKDSVAQKITVTDVNRKPVFNSRVPSAPTVISRNVATTFAVSATDPDGGALTWTWRVNGVTVKTGSTAADSALAQTFTDAHGTAKTVIAVFADPAGLKDSTTWNFTITPVEDIVLPTEFNLGQNYPNPFNPTTTISFSLPKEAPVTFEIYNMLGVRIRTLMAGQTKSAGMYTVAWDGRDDAGVSMSSGVYLYRVSAGSFLASKKMTLLK